MADWASSVDKITPGARSYLFTGPAGNALDHLVDRAIAPQAHRRTLRPPLHPEQLRLTSYADHHVIIVRDLDTATDDDLTHLDRHLRQSRDPHQSTIMVGTRSPNTPAGKTLRARVTRQKGSLVDVSDPTGAVGRRHLIEWVTATWHTTTAVATLACERASYSIETLLWATHRFTALTQGQPTEGHRADLLTRLVVPLTDTQVTYRMLLDRDPEAVTTAARLDRRATLGLLHLLETTLTDLSALYPVLTGGASPAVAADKTGLHPARVRELADWAPRYPPPVIQHCRQLLALGLSHQHQPEAASTVALLWSH